MPVVTVTYNTFSTTVQHFTVPAGITVIDVQIRGADGGRSLSVGSPSGRGAAFRANLAVTPLEILDLWVGNAGGSASSNANLGTGTAGWPDGGQGGQGPTTHRGGGGGGSTRVYRGATLLIGVAGGGGAPGRAGAYSLAGDAALDNASTASDGGPTITQSGHGATPSAGGAAGTGTDGSQTAGGLWLGGNGALGVATVPGVGGGGGGGGLYGGGGGARQGGGGGGVSYLASGVGWSSIVWTPRLNPQTEPPTQSGFGASIFIRYNTDPVGGGGRWHLGS